MGGKSLERSTPKCKGGKQPKWAVFIPPDNMRN